MTLRRKIWLAAAICGACFFGFRCCSSVPASAAVDYVTLTPSQTRALFGDSLSITYFDGNDWQTGTLSYLTSAAEIATAPDFGNSSADRDLFNALAPEDTRYIVYSASDLNISSNSQYQINLEPQINFTNTLLTQFVCGVSCSSSYTVQPRYSPYNYVQYFVNGNQVTSSAFTYGQGSASWWLPFHFYVGTGQYQSDRYFLMYPINYNNESVYGTVNSFKITADSTAVPATNICRFIVSCPRISLSTSYGQDAGSSGTDLTATNSKLDSIISILSLIAQSMEDNNSSGGDGHEGPAFEVPLFLDNKLLEIDPELDFYFNVPVIFGGSDSGISSQGITNGGQVFLPDGESTPMIQADPTNGGVLAGTGSIFDMFNRLLKINPVISKLICIFLAGSIASWAIFEGRG